MHQNIFYCLHRPDIYIYIFFFAIILYLPFNLLVILSKLIWMCRLIIKIRNICLFVRFSPKKR